jgi:hypothetical protein
MKTRTGFVSNSSSTSFTLCGVTMNAEKVEEYFGTDEPFSLECDNDKGIEVWKNPNDYGSWAIYYIGMILDGTQEYCAMKSAMKNDETREQFQKRVEGVLSEIAGKPIECGFHSAGWHNG